MAMNQRMGVAGSEQNHHFLIVDVHYVGSLIGVTGLALGAQRSAKRFSLVKGFGQDVIPPGLTTQRSSHSLVFVIVNAQTITMTQY